MGLKAHLEIQEGLGGLPEDPSVVKRPYRRTSTGQEVFPKVRHGS